MQRKFVRLCEDDRSVTYQLFREWIGPAPITDQMWSELMEEDEVFDYLTQGVGRKELNENNGEPYPAFDNICAEEVIQSCRGGELCASELGGEGNNG